MIPRSIAQCRAAALLQPIPVMLPVALLVGLDAEKADACRSALDGNARLIAVMDTDDAIMMLSLHRPKLVVMQTDLLLSHKRTIADLTGKIGARLASVAANATAASVERLIEGFVAVTFSSENEPPRAESGTRPRVRPGAYHLETPRTLLVFSKTAR